MTQYVVEQCVHNCVNPDTLIPGTHPATVVRREDSNITTVTPHAPSCKVVRPYPKNVHCPRCRVGKDRVVKVVCTCTWRCSHPACDGGVE